MVLNRSTVLPERQRERNVADRAGSKRYVTSRVLTSLGVTQQAHTFSLYWSMYITMTLTVSLSALAQLRLPMLDLERRP